MACSDNGIGSAKTDVKRIELNAHTQMSEMDSVLPVRDVIRKATDWGWRAVAITDYESVQTFPEAMKIARHYGIKVIYGMDVYMTENTSEESVGNHISVLARNEKGLFNLYLLVTNSYFLFFHKQPRIPQYFIQDCRDNLLLGSSGIEGELVRGIAADKSDKELLSIAEFYDYLEIQPAENYSVLIADGKFPCIKSDEDLKNINRKIVEISQRTGKMLVATGDVHYLNKEDAICRKIILNAAGKKDNDTRSSRFLRTTDEMLQNLSYLGDEVAHEAVVVSPNRIADMIDEIEPSREKYLPDIPNAHDIIKSLSYNRAIELYGINLPLIVQERLDKELGIIFEHKYASLYLLSQRLAQKAHECGHITCTRGSVSASLVAHLIGITEVNPLFPHWHCPKCQYSEFVTDGSVVSGFDLPIKHCPKCGDKLIGDGHDIPYATFVGFDGSKQPDIDINFPMSYRSIAGETIKEVFDNARAYAAGTIETLSYHDAVAYVQNYIDAVGIIPERLSAHEMAEKCVGTKKTTGINDSAFVIIPNEVAPGCFTPLQYVKNEEGHKLVTTHFSYHDLTNNFLKLDVLSYFVLSILEKLEAGTGCNLLHIPFDDPPTISLFQKADTVGVPEFHSAKVRRMLQELQPTSFSELVKVSAISHGIGAWEENAQKLIRQGVCSINEIVATRDDIMMYLIRKEVDPMLAFQVMESVRKGKGIISKTELMLRAKGGPDWYINSCQKIGYLFPRAHVVDYVIMNYRMAYYKAHYPQEFYRTYIEILADEADMTVIKSGEATINEHILVYRSKDSDEESNNGKIELLELAIEMYLRGYNLDVQIK